MKNNDHLNSNPFYCLAQALWKGGEDGEVIARQLAVAFKEISDLGVGVGLDTSEYIRLRLD